MFWVCILLSAVYPLHARWWGKACARFTHSWYTSKHLYLPGLQVQCKHGFFFFRMRFKLWKTYGFLAEQTNGIKNANTKFFSCHTTVGDGVRRNVRKFLQKIIRKNNPRFTLNEIRHRKPTGKTSLGNFQLGVKNFSGLRSSTSKSCCFQLEGAQQTGIVFEARLILYGTASSLWSLWLIPLPVSPDDFVRARRQRQHRMDFECFVFRF